MATASSLWDDGTRLNVKKWGFALLFYEWDGMQGTLLVTMLWLTIIEKMCAFFMHECM